MPCQLVAQEPAERLCRSARSSHCDRPLMLETEKGTGTTVCDGVVDEVGVLLGVGEPPTVREAVALGEAVIEEENVA